MKNGLKKGFAKDCLKKFMKIDLFNYILLKMTYTATRNIWPKTLFYIKLMLNS